MRSASSSSKSEVLEKSCSLLPQTEAVLLCDYSQYLTEEIHIRYGSLPAVLHQSWLNSQVMLLFFAENTVFIVVEW